MITLGFAALATGIVFGQLNIASSRNPDESSKMYSTSLTSFALIETFVFIAISVASVASLIL